MRSPTASVARETRLRATLGGAVSTLSPLVLFAVLEPAVRGLGRLPIDAYERPFFLSGLPARVAYLATERAPLALSLAAIVLVAIPVFASGRRFLGRLFQSWSALSDGVGLCWFVAALTAIAAWTFSTHAYNSFFDQTHLLDRLILLGLWALLVWRPVFALPFALVLMATVNQLALPLGVYSWTEVDLLIRIPILFGSFWIVRSFTRSDDATTFLFLFCCMLAATYWASGWGKIETGWIRHPYIDFLLIGAWASGWLAFLEAESIAGIAQTMARFNVPLMLFTLIAECGAILFLWRRRMLLGLLGAWIAFHLVAFALSGIFFWKWILVEIAFLTFLLRGRRLDRLAFFTPVHFGLSVLLILGSPFWMDPVSLTWFDTPLTYATRLEAIGASGASYSLHAGHFKPHAEVLTLGPFHYLSPYQHLTGGMGVTNNADLAAELATARQPQEIYDMEARLGSVRYDPAQSARFDEFVARYLRVLNRGPGIPFRGLAPRHLWSYPRAGTWEGQEPIVSLRVLEITVFYDGGTVREIRHRLLRTIDVETGIGTPAPTR